MQYLQRSGTIIHYNSKNDSLKFISYNIPNLHVIEDGTFSENNGWKRVVCFWIFEMNISHNW
ncbi:hypothetical protein HK096_004939 [Nowakowskiella sp. JEL0078]|nr:hypothetical protein HK096_004939 [Nowakowskiella sp. JEL0078]